MNRPPSQTPDGHPPLEPGDSPERLKRFRLEHVIRRLPELPRFTGDVLFDPSLEQMQPFYVRAMVRDFEDLKWWIGVPDERADPAKFKLPVREVRAERLRSEPKGEPAEAAQAFADARFNLLYGHARGQLARTPTLSVAVERLLRELPEINILVGQDLVVENGREFVFSNTPTAYFNKVTINGTGRIRVVGACKVIASVVQHLP